MDTHQVGQRFEDAAAAWLMARGWTLVDRNVRFRRKEIDLIIRRGELIAFVEVKGRQGASYGHPVEAVTRRKRGEIEFVARWWVERFGSANLTYRFDVVTVRVEREELEIDHREDAWRPGC